MCAKVVGAGGGFLIYSLLLRVGGLNKILSKYMGMVAYKKGAAYKSEYGIHVCRKGKRSEGMYRKYIIGKS